MREKVTASNIFKDRKTSYPRRFNLLTTKFYIELIIFFFSISHPFVGDYVRLRHNVQWRKISVESNDQYVVFADIINKIARSSGKVFKLFLFVLLIHI